MDIIKGDFKDTGINEVDINLISSKWNHLWMLTEWKMDNSWRVIKYLRKDSEITTIKITISWRQANEIVKKVGLIPINSGFSSGYSWRTKKDMEMLDNWRRKKFKIR
jgi:hypothetical protein